MALTATGWAFCDVVLGANRGSTQLVPHLGEACFQVDSLIFEGVHCGAHAALTSIGSHYGDVDFDAVGRGYASRKSKNDVLAIGSAAAQGAEVLTSKMSTTSIHLQCQSSDV